MSYLTYFAETGDGLVKIGQSRNPSRRVKEIRPSVKMIGIVESAVLPEKKAHLLFRQYRSFGEFFRIETHELLQTLLAVGVTLSKPKKIMQKVLIELDDDDGDLLDRLAEEQDRSRSAQARRMLLRAIREATGQTIIKEGEDQ